MYSPNPFLYPFCLWRIQVIYCKFFTSRQLSSSQTFNGGLSCKLRTTHLYYHAEIKLYSSKKALTSHQWTLNTPNILFNKFYLCKANPKVLCKSENLFLHINNFFFTLSVWEEWRFDCFIYRNPLSLFKNIDIGISSFLFSLKANCCTVYNSSKCPNNQGYPMTTWL